MKKAIFYNIFGVGHIHPTLPIVRELCAQGWEIIYHTSPERRDLVESAGAIFCNYGYDDYKAADFNPDKSFPLQLIPATVGLMPFLVQEIENVKPDFLFYDSMAPWGYCLSEYFQIPAICTVTTFALNPQIRRKMYAFYGIEIDEVNRNAIAYLQEKYNVRLELINALGSYNNCNLVFTSPQFNPSLDDMEQKNFHFIGSMTIGRKEEVDSPLEMLHASGRKIVYLSVGTILGEEDPSLIEIFRMLLEALGGDSRFSIVLSMGALDVQKLGNLPENCLAYKYVPQLELLKITDIFINHAGMNSVNEGLHFATPQIVIPISGDQFVNANRVEELKLGIQLKRSSVTTEILKQSIQKILEDTEYQKNCDAICNSFQNCLGYNGAMKIIYEKFL